MTEVDVTTVEDTDESDEGSPTITKQRSSVQDTSPSKANDYGSIQRRSTGSWRNRIFDFRSGRKCPTCQGTGNIPRGQDDELVALIPYSDKRLRPRRRWIYVCIVLCVVLVFGVLLLAFMFPRSATISLTSMNSSTDFIPIKNHSDIIVVMQTHVHIKNSNFFDLSVQHLRIKLYNINTLVGIAVQTSFTVSARGDTMAVVQQNATFTDELAKRVRTICTGNGWKHCLYMLAEAQLQYTVLSHSAEAVTSDYFFVSCDFIETGEEWTYSNSCTS